MSNENKLAVVVARSFSLANAITANSFDYGDGALQRKRLAIAMNLISLSEESGPPTFRELWEKMDKNHEAKEALLEQRAGKHLPTHEADENLHEIWDAMDDHHKQKHLNDHPQSKFHVIEQHNEDAAELSAEEETKKSIEDEEKHDALRENDKRRNRNKRVKNKKKGQEDPNDDTWWKKLTLTEQKKYLREHPNSKKAKRQRIMIRNLSMKAIDHIHQEVRKMHHDYKHGMAGIRALRSGKKMTPEQKEGLKNTGKRVAVILLGALAGAAMFTPLLPFALDAGEKYVNELGGNRKRLEQAHMEPEEKKADDEKRQKEQDEKETTVGQTDDSKKSDSETTVGQVDNDVSESGTNLYKHMKRKKLDAERNDEMELDWMRRDMTEWLLDQDTEKLAAEFKKKHDRRK